MVALWRTRDVAALIIELLGVYFLWGKDPRIIDTSFPQKIVDRSGSILSKATVRATTDFLIK
jgi:hypothetical protein